MGNTNKVVTNIVWQCFDKCWRMGIGIVVGVWLARYLGPEQYGILNYAQAFSAIFASIAGLGLDSIVVREIVKAPEKKDEILGSSFCLKMIGGILSIALTVIGMVVLPPHDFTTKCIIIIISCGVIFQAFDAVDFWFQAELKSKYTVYAKNTAFSMAAFLKVILLLFDAPLIAFAWVSLIEIIMGAVGMIVAYRYQGGKIKALSFSSERAKELLSDSWPLIISGIVIMVYMRIDQIMLGQISGQHAVGVYSVAVRLAESWYFLPISIVASFFPTIVEAKKTSEELFYRRLQKLYNLMALLAYAVAIPTTFLAGWVINILYGPSFSESAPILSLLIWAGLFVNLGVARSSFLSAMNWTKMHFFTTAIGGVLNIILNLILIPKYEGLGAALASFISYGFVVYVTCFLYKELRETGKMLSKSMVIPWDVFFKRQGVE